MKFDDRRKSRAKNKRTVAQHRLRRNNVKAETLAEARKYGVVSAGGRITKLTNQVYHSICQLLAEGNTLEVSGTLSGVDPSTVWAWIRQGQADPNGPFAQFARDVAYAKEASHRFLVHKIANHDDWKASAWLLKNRLPHLYSDRLSQEISGPEGKPIPMSLQTFSVVIEMHPSQAPQNDEQQREPEFRIVEGASDPVHAAQG